MPGLCLCAFGMLIVLAFAVALHGLSGVAYLVDTYVAPAFLAILMSKAPARFLRRLVRLDARAAPRERLPRDRRGEDALAPLPVRHRRHSGNRGLLPGHRARGPSVAQRDAQRPCHPRRRRRAVADHDPCRAARSARDGHACLRWTHGADRGAPRLRHHFVTGRLLPVAPQAGRGGARSLGRLALLLLGAAVLGLVFSATDFGGRIRAGDFTDFSSKPRASSSSTSSILSTSKASSPATTRKLSTG